MEYNEIRELEKALKKKRDGEQDEFERLARIYRLCITNLVSRPNKHFLRSGYYCPECDKKLESEISYYFFHLSCSCGYEWVDARGDRCESEVVKELRESVLPNIENWSLGRWFFERICKGE